MKLSPRLISTVRWLLLSAAALATLLAFIVTVENWRGDRAWRDCERALAARGEQLGASAFRQPAVPDARNFFKAPVLESLLYSERQKPPASTLLASVNFNPISGAAASNDWSDLEAARRRFKNLRLLSEPFSPEPAADLLAALQPTAPLLDAFRLAARERPETWLPSQDLTKDQLPNVGTLFDVGKLLAFRAHLEVSLGRMDDARADLEAVLRLAAGMRSGSLTLLQVLVGEALYNLTAFPIDQGVREHRWSDAQLAALQSHFSRYQAIAAMRDALRTERAWSIAYLDATDLPAMAEFQRWWFLRGWSQQNKVRISRFIDNALAALDADAGVLRRNQFAVMQAEAAQLRATRGPYARLARMVTAKVDGIIQSFAKEANSSTRLLAVIALERHWLAHRDYPASLAALDVSPFPQPLRDAFDGQPFGYTRLSAENYSLSFVTGDKDVRSAWSLHPAR